MISHFDTDTEAQGLVDFVDASPSPFHVVRTAAGLLEASGFRAVSERDAFPTAAGRHYVVRGGSIVAWSTRERPAPLRSFRVVGAHTDSPNLRIKPQPDLTRAGIQLLGVEPYGGPLLSSWLDRDLGLSGRVAVRDGKGVGTRLLFVDEPILRVAQLAIHLDQAVREGLVLNSQQHLSPLWAIGDQPGDFRGWLGEQVGVAAEDVLAWDVMTQVCQPSRRIGRDLEFVAAPRLDNQMTCRAGLAALLHAVEAPGEHVPVLVLFDHEEAGSMSERGAHSTLLPQVLERIVLAGGGTREDQFRALAGTVVASGDVAHATHPNYADRHEPQHQIAIDGGPVLKVNTGLKYATDAVGAGAFALACEQADVPMQRYAVRSDLPSGSTVGPMTSALTGATTVDVGAPILSMHSSRELCAATGPAMYAAALAAFLAPASPQR
ncbi:MAG: M18 family aminopeptidase [Actinomycetota bacterium]|nr:M18 family aminopeptidase [Actinomycetota bacterium]